MPVQVETPTWCRAVKLRRVVEARPRHKVYVTTARITTAVPFPFHSFFLPFTCALHEAYPQASTQAEAFLFNAWFSRSQDWRNPCCSFCRANPQPKLFLPPPTNPSYQVLNKVAGIYGLIALLTGAGGNAAQLTLYIYSALALIALSWGIRAVHDVRSIIRSSSSTLSHILSPHRRIRSTCSILPTYFSPTTS